MEWLWKLLGFFSTASDARAIVLAILGGLFFTQWIKFLFPDEWSDAAHKRAVRIASTLLTSAICLVLWPPGELRWYALGGVSVVLGLGSPTIYWLVMKVTVHRWPWLNDALSARPDPKE